jgi:hypothetical protein
VSVATEDSVRLLPTAVGGHVAEQRTEDTQRNCLPTPGRELGIAVVWSVFYAVLAIAAAIHHGLGP